VHRGRQLAISTTEITDGRGKRVAVATGTTMLGTAAATEQEPAGVSFESS
jgi:acyl-coenzyme A thioesterase PaaI-like protein